MKIIKIVKTLIIISALIFGTQAIAKIAEVMVPVEPESTNAVKTTREIINESDQNKDEITDIKKHEDSAPEEVKSKLTDDIIKDLRSCKPQDEKYDFDLFGLNLSFRINIKGWVEDKCEYHMSAKVNSLGEEFRKSFGINVEDKKISQIVPRVECAFTKKQLNLLVDAVVEEDKRNVEQVNKLLNDPNAVYDIPSNNELTPSEKKLMDMLSQGEVCTIVNIDEVVQQMSELLPASTDEKK